jgi:hypothetical protein
MVLWFLQASKAMNDKAGALATGDAATAAFYGARVDLFTLQAVLSIQKKKPKWQQKTKRPLHASTCWAEM